MRYFQVVCLVRTGALLTRCAGFTTCHIIRKQGGGEMFACAMNLNGNETGSTILMLYDYKDERSDADTWEVRDRPLSWRTKSCGALLTTEHTYWFVRERKLRRYA